VILPTAILLLACAYPDSDWERWPACYAEFDQCIDRCIVETCEPVRGNCLALRRHAVFARSMTGPGGSLMVVLRPKGLQALVLYGTGKRSYADVTAEDVGVLRGCDADHDGDLDLADFAAAANGQPMED